MDRSFILWGPPKGSIQKVVSHATANIVVECNDRSSSMDVLLLEKIVQYFESYV